MTVLYSKYTKSLMPPSVSNSTPQSPSLRHLHIRQPPDRSGGPFAIFFVIARPLVHDLRLIGIPIWRIFMIQAHNPFRLGRECAERHPSRNVEGNTSAIANTDFPSR